MTVCTRSCQFYANIFMLFLFQFMLKEFEARRQQHEQLNQAAQSILTGPGDVSPSTSQVRDELQGVNQKWSELTERLNSRSSQIDQAIVKSTQYQELLQGLSEKVKAVGQRLSSQSAISTQPDAVKQQLEETSEIRSDLEQLEEEISEAQSLCDDLSVLIGEQYLKDELRKRLETVALPLKGLEDLAGEMEELLKMLGCQAAPLLFAKRLSHHWVYENKQGSTIYHFLGFFLLVLCDTKHGRVPTSEIPEPGEGAEVFSPTDMTLHQAGWHMLGKQTRFLNSVATL